MLKAATMFGQGQNFMQAANFALYESMNAASYATERGSADFRRARLLQGL